MYFIFNFVNYKKSAIEDNWNSVFLLVSRLAGELAESFISGSLGSSHSFLARLDLHLSALIPVSQKPLKKLEVPSK